MLAQLESVIKPVDARLHCRAVLKEAAIGLLGESRNDQVLYFARETHRSGLVSPLAKTRDGQGPT